MDATEVVVLVEDAWKNALPERRLPAIRSLRKLIPVQHHALFDSLIDAKTSGVADDPEATILFLVHGIQTDGAWQKHVQEAFRDIPKLNIVDIGYDCVTPAQLASPFRNQPINKVLWEIRNARRREPLARLMVIAHSFGTYIISRIIAEHPDIEFERVVLCGSIVPRSYKWDLFARNMPRGSILNHVGTRDFYPVLATFSSVGYGASGRLGFNAAAVIDKYFDYGHSDFFEPDKEHIRKFWKPFIQHGTVVESDWDIRKPKTSIPILMLCHPWIGRPAALCLLGAIASSATVLVYSLWRWLS